MPHRCMLLLSLHGEMLTTSVLLPARSPSMPICNLFFRQLLVHPYGQQAPASQLLGLPPASDPGFQTALRSYGVAVDGSCFIPRAGFVGGEPGYLGNIANLILVSARDALRGKMALRRWRTRPDGDSRS